MRAEIFLILSLCYSYLRVVYSKFHQILSIYDEIHAGKNN